MKVIRFNNFKILCFCILILFIPESGITGPKKNVVQSLEDFYLVPLEKGEIVFMPLGIYSNIMVRTQDKVILFDPSVLIKPDLEILKTRGVDLVVYTHAHSDHFSKDTAIKLLKDSNPYIVMDKHLAPQMETEMPKEKLIIAESGQSYTAGDITITGLKGEHLGPIMLFRITIGNVSIFHGGDSAYVSLGSMDADIAFVPTGAPSPTCSPDYAFRMVSDVKPKIIVPMHGMDSEHEAFRKLVERELPDGKVIITEPFKSVKVAVQ